jgi:xanthine phosphoribosyltransferase
MTHPTIQPIIEPPRHKISWQAFATDCQKLVPLLQPYTWQGIVAVARGGLVPAAILAQALEIRCVTSISLASYANTGPSVQGHITQTISSVGDIGTGAGWLFIDDLADSGSTALWLRQHYPQAKLAVVYAKTQSAHLVDFWGTMPPSDMWLDFPWEN